jgi:pyruvate formate-lyase/glycerol dehydratase family glycyl radical enzyme
MSFPLQSFDRYPTPEREKRMEQRRTHKSEMSFPMDAPYIPFPERTQTLKRKILEAPYEICMERARCYTQIYRETEGMHPSLRAARALARTLDTMTLSILPEELLVGNRSSKLVATVIPVERGEINAILEMYMHDITTRPYKPFKISKEEKRELFEDIFPYWKKKSVRYFKEQEWTKRDLILGFSSGPLAQARRIRAFGASQLAKTLRPFMVGRRSDILRAKREVSLNNPNLVNNVMDVQGHMVLGINNIIEKGFRGIKESALEKKTLHAQDFGKTAFYDAVILTCDAVKRLAERYARMSSDMADRETDKRRGQELRAMASNLESVPWNPPRNFYEAVESLWFTQVIATISYGTVGDSAIGRADQYLYPYFKRDMDSGAISREFAVGLIEELLIKLSCNLLVLPSFAKQTGSELGADNNAVTIGGVDREGKDAANELTVLFLEAAGNIKCMSNSFAIRIHSQSSPEFLEKVTQLVSLTNGPAIFNDQIIIPSQEGCGHSLEDARDYAIIGCVEPTSSGNTFGCTAGNDISLVGVLEMALNNGRLFMMGRRTGVKTGDPENFRSFEDVQEAYRKQLTHSVAFLARCVNAKDEIYRDHFHNPYVSLTLDGCLDSGMDVTQGGARYNYGSISARGLATTADSLTAVKKAVFEEKWISMSDLVTALRTNFRDNEILRQKLIHKITKYGCNSNEADDLARWVADQFCEEVLKQKPVRGSSFRPGFFSYGMHVFDGMMLGATPDGRRAGEPVSNSLSPSNGSERKGLIAVLNSNARLPHEKISNGSSLNIRLSPSMFSTSESRGKFVGLLKGFVMNGNMHMQFNVIDGDTLRDAQQEPQMYADMVVRVSGYSAYFTDLGRPLQDDLIKRTQFDNY